MCPQHEGCARKVGLARRAHTGRDLGRKKDWKNRRGAVGIRGRVWEWCGGESGQKCFV